MCGLQLLKCHTVYSETFISYITAGTLCSLFKHVSCVLTVCVACVSTWLRDRELHLLHRPSAHTMHPLRHFHPPPFLLLILTTTGGKACKNKSCIIPQKIHDIKYLVLFYLTEMLKERKHAAQMHPQAFFFFSSSSSPQGLLPGSQCAGVFAFHPLTHGLSVIKGCGVQKRQKKEKKEGKRKSFLKLYLVSRLSPVSRQQTSYEIRRF